MRELDTCVSRENKGESIYLVEDENVARHSGGEIMVNGDSMAFLDFVEERHLSTAGSCRGS